MPVDKDTVLRIAQLARLKVPEADLAALASELSNILGWIEQLAAVDTEGVPPMASVANIKLRWRPDVVDDGNCRERVLANAPAPEGGFFTVPKVVE